MKPVPDAERLKAKTEGQAKERFRLFFQRSISCVSPGAQLYVAPSLENPVNSVILEPTEHFRPVPLHLSDGSPLFLEFLMSGDIIPDERYSGEFRITRTSYYYAVRGEDPANRLLMWHWHPGVSPDHPEPHIHAPITDPEGVGTKLHVPTGGLVTIEEVLSFLVNEWGVSATDDWRDVMADSQYRYDRFQVQDKRRAKPIKLPSSKRPRR